MPAVLRGAAAGVPAGGHRCRPLLHLHGQGAPPPRVWAPASPPVRAAGGGAQSEPRSWEDRPPDHGRGFGVTMTPLEALAHFRPSGHSGARSGPAGRASLAAVGWMRNIPTSGVMYTTEGPCAGFILWVRLQDCYVLFTCLSFGGRELPVGARVPLPTRSLAPPSFLLPGDTPDPSWGLPAPAPAVPLGGPGSFTRPWSGSPHLGARLSWPLASRETARDMGVPTRVNGCAPEHSWVCLPPSVPY